MTHSSFAAALLAAAVFLWPSSGLAWTEEVTAEGKRVIRMEAHEIPWVHYAQSFLDMADDLRRLEAVQDPDGVWLYRAFLHDDLGIPKDADEAVAFVTDVLVRFYAVKSRLGSPAKAGVSVEQEARLHYTSVASLYQELNEGLEARNVSTEHWPALIRSVGGVSLVLILEADETVDGSLAHNRSLLETPREAFQ